MEPLDPQAPNVFDGLITVLGGVIVAILAWLGKNKKPEPEPTAILSGALMDSRQIDPLVLKLGANTTALERLCDLMEKEVGLRQSAVDENRRTEERKAMALAIADQVREDILAEMRLEIERKAPAPMPPIRKPRQE